MANQVLLIGNPTGTAYSNVNAAGDDIAAYSIGSVQTNTNGLVTLSDAEQATFAAAHPEAIMILFASAAATATAVYAAKRAAAKLLKYRTHAAVDPL